MSDLRPPKNGTPTPHPVSIPKDQLAGVLCSLCKGKRFYLVQVVAFAFDKLDPERVQLLPIGNNLTCLQCGAIVRQTKEGRWTTAWRCVCPEQFGTKEKLQEHLEAEHVELAPEAVEKHLEKES